VAYVVNQSMIEPGNPAAFEPVYHPGTAAPYSGIYRCMTCGHEAVSTLGHPLPPQHLAHSHAQPILWRLIAAARHA
jgi:hypothetical protein